MNQSKIMFLIILREGILRYCFPYQSYSAFFFHFNSYLAQLKKIFFFIQQSLNWFVFMATNLVSSWAVFHVGDFKCFYTVRVVIVTMSFRALIRRLVPFPFQLLPLTLAPYFLLCFRFVFAGYYLSLGFLLYRYHSKDPGVIYQEACGCLRVPVFPASLADCLAFCQPEDNRLQWK